MKQLSEFESDMMRLHWVAIRLEVLYNGFHNYKIKDDEEGWFKNALREYMIIQFHNFIKIRNSLIKQSDECKIIDDCL